MSELDLLLAAYESHVSTPWRSGLSGAEKVWFLVHTPVNERRVRRRLPEFEIATGDAKHGWRHVDLTDAFPRWLAAQRHCEAAFARPTGIPKARFVATVGDTLRQELAKAGSEDVVAVTGVASLFGITSLSAVVKLVEAEIRGRMAVFFPGKHEGSAYKFLETGDGWNYHAIPITSTRGGIK